MCVSGELLGGCGGLAGVGVVGLKGGKGEGLHNSTG